MKKRTEIHQDQQRVIQLFVTIGVAVAAPRFARDVFPTPNNTTAFCVLLHVFYYASDGWLSVVVFGAARYDAAGRSVQRKVTDQKIHL